MSVVDQVGQSILALKYRGLRPKTIFLGLKEIREVWYQLEISENSLSLFGAKVIQTAEESYLGVVPDLDLDELITKNLGGGTRYN